MVALESCAQPQECGNHKWGPLFWHTGLWESLLRTGRTSQYCHHLPHFISSGFLAPNQLIVNHVIEGKMPFTSHLGTQESQRRFYPVKDTKTPWRLREAPGCSRDEIKNKTKQKNGTFPAPASVSSTILWNIPCTHVYLQVSYASINYWSTSFSESCLSDIYGALP